MQLFEALKTKSQLNSPITFAGFLGHGGNSDLFVRLKLDALLTSAVSEIGVCGWVVFAESLQDLFIMQQSVQRPQDKHI